MHQPPGSSQQHSGLSNPPSARGEGSYATASGQLPGSQPADPMWRAKALEVVRRLCQHKVVEPFIEPVPRSTPGYYDVVTRPMDLKTVMTNLDRGVYQKPGEAYADISQVWANCHLYNQDGSDIAQCADRAKQALDALWLQYVK